MSFHIRLPPYCIAIGDIAMQSIRFRCPECQSVLRIPGKYAGKQVRCPQSACRKQITIPSAKSVEPLRCSNLTQTSIEEVRPKKQEKKLARKTGKPVSKRKRGQSQKSRQPFRLICAIICLVLLAGAVGYFLPSGSSGDVSQQSNAVQASVPESLDQHVKPFLNKYCIDCHGEDIQEGGVRFDQFGSTLDILADYRLWEKIHQQISVGSMPPQDEQAPEQDERKQVAAWLDKQVNHFDCNAVDHPGRVTVHRLNRVEYDNTIRDLLGVDLKLSVNFPSDDVGYGFDNIGDVLTVSPLLMERYLDAAEKASEAAIILPESLKVEKKFQGKGFRLTGAAGGRGNEVSFVSNGAAIAPFDVKIKGEYQFEVTVSASQAGEGNAKCRLFLDDRELSYPEVPGHRKKKTIRFSENVSQGKHQLRIVFDNDFYAPKAEDPKRRDRNLFLHSAMISGPTSLTLEQFPAAYRKIVTAQPGKKQTPAQSAEKVLVPLLERAFRRPVSKQEQERILGIFQLAYNREKHYERSLQIALQAILVSPQFLFRLERDSKLDQKPQGENLDDYELASRLSYFLWSSMPDSELFELAKRGVLHQDKILTQQVHRMLADPKAEAITENFVGQWLGLRKLSDATPDKELFPNFNPNIAQAMQKETISLFSYVLENDMSLMELLTANYTFLDQELARFYGIKGVKGKKFQKVDISKTKRRGLIAHAGILTLTSYPNRTSPVKRGEWVLENILAQAPPPPPAGVPPLDDTQKENPNLSLREQLLLHQSDPICSSCHILMDGIGFGLQNFDAVGRWRDTDGKHKIDARGDLPDGSSFEGPVELIQILEKRPDEFTRCIAEKMLTFALGRGLEWYDRCTIDEIVAAVRRDDYRLSRVIVEIVRSDPFRRRRGEGK